MAKKRAKKRKQKAKSSTKTEPAPKQKSNDGRKKAITIGIVIVIPIALYLLFFTGERGGLRQPKRPEAGQLTTRPLSEPQFKKEGELVFLKKESKEPIRKIDIEIAEKPLERQQGLMYRTAMSDSAGMLFIFEEARLQSFWMKDTYISLDIIYVAENKEIVTIHRNAKPRSEDSIFSYKNAMYVVEVIGGFCDKFGVREGDFISFSKL